MKKIRLFNKKINLEWVTNDLTKILIVISLTYSSKDMLVYDENLVLKSINLLNGTALTLNDVDVSVKPDGHSAIITAKQGKDFTGEVNIINENLMFDQLIKETELGTITINKEVYKIFRENEQHEQWKPMVLAATIMEYIGDRNRAFSIYQKAFATILLKAKYKGELFESEGTFSLIYDKNNIVSPSSFKVHFKFIVGENKYYLNVNNEKIEMGDVTDPNPVIKIKINYTLLQNDNFNLIRKKVVIKTLGQEFINKYSDLLYDEINIITADYSKGIITLVPKAGSRLFEISDSAARVMTKKANYIVSTQFEIDSNN
ncbi:hypothetical protein [Spiroplasma endosymbiont of Glossina fuscipes fuscipes]|uniref:hypothetical protein n=1 Tax=Spiroplasma endosymbiont of Glossina fuscipes fuscipes TaxID=2004463 RepID=UPI003C794742